jgi:fructokinase
VDTTGAGDGFVAGFLARASLGGDQIGENADLARKAVIYACAVGAMVTRRAGAIRIPTNSGTGGGVSSGL